jgi:hypothetical protein
MNYETISKYGSPQRFAFRGCCLKTTKRISHSRRVAQPYLYSYQHYLHFYQHYLYSYWRVDIWNEMPQCMRKFRMERGRRRCGTGSGMSTGNYACQLFPHGDLSNTASGMEGGLMIALSI